MYRIKGYILANYSYRNQLLHILRLYQSHYSYSTQQAHRYHSGANISEVPDIIDTVVKAGADVYAFARYCPTSGEKDTGMTPQDYRQLLDICYQGWL